MARIRASRMPRARQEVFPRPAPEWPPPPKRGPARGRLTTRLLKRATLARSPRSLVAKWFHTVRQPERIADDLARHWKRPDNRRRRCGRDRRIRGRAGSRVADCPLLPGRGRSLAPRAPG